LSVRFHEPSLLFLIIPSITLNLRYVFANGKLGVVQRSYYNISLQAERSGGRIPLVVWFSSPVQTGLESTEFLIQWVPVHFRMCSCRRVALTILSSVEDTQIEFYFYSSGSFCVF